MEDNELSGENEQHEDTRVHHNAIIKQRDGHLDYAYYKYDDPNITHLNNNINNNNADKTEISQL